MWRSGIIRPVVSSSALTWFIGYICVKKLAGPNFSGYVQSQNIGKPASGSKKTNEPTHDSHTQLRLPMPVVD
jgi:hypothetical protein